MRAYRRNLTLVALLGLAVRLMWALPILATDPARLSEGDYVLYDIGAEHILAEGDFSNSLFLVRPPLFPLIVAALGGHNWAIILLNSVAGAVLAALTGVVAQQLGLTHGAALLAAGLVALDPLTVKYTAFLGPEALSFLGALVMASALLAMAQTQHMGRALGWGALAALALLFSAYTRPSIYLIWTGLSVYLLVTHPRKWYAIALYAVMSVAGIQAWAAHNAAVFGHRTFSTVGPYTMTYYRALSVLRLGDGMTVDEADLEIARRVETALDGDPEDVTLATKHGYLAASPAVADALVSTSVGIFRDNPGTYLLTLPVGAVRFLDLAPNVPPMKNLWNPMAYPLVLWNWVVLVAAVAGVIHAARQRHWALFWWTVLVIGYFSAGTLLVKSAGLSGRERTVLFPMMAIAAAYSTWALWTARRRST